jgi:hypothetical protein
LLLWHRNTVEKQLYWELFVMGQKHCRWTVFSHAHAFMRELFVICLGHFYPMRGLPGQLKFGLCFFFCFSAPIFVHRLFGSFWVITQPIIYHCAFNGSKCSDLSKPLASLFSWNCSVFCPTLIIFRGPLTQLFGCWTWWVLKVLARLDQIVCVVSISFGFCSRSWWVWF